ncbi:MAG: MerR family transcriptional regulator [Clostridium sp.]
MISDFKRKYLSIGEFAKLCEVPRKTLIFYDNLGIFSPEYKNEKGYRFYSINQYDTFAILAELREMGMPLDEIKDYLDKRNPENYIEMLYSEKEKINEKINKLKFINEAIDNKIKVAKVGLETIENKEPYIKMVEKEYLIATDINSKTQKDITLEIIDFISYCIKQDLYKGYPISAMVSEESIKNGDFTDIDKICMKLDDEIESDKLIIKEEGLYACINHKGSYETTYKSYKILVDFIKENNYVIVGSSYEMSLLDYFSIKSEEEYITEIAIPIELG